MSRKRRKGDEMTYTVRTLTDGTDDVIGTTPSRKAACVIAQSASAAHGTTTYVEHAAGSLSLDVPAWARCQPVVVVMFVSGEEFA